MTVETGNGAYWIATAPDISFPRLSGDMEVDVAIIGGGIVGTTAASLLKAEGLKVTLIEARKVGQEVTGKSTAKITSQHNLIYTRLRKRYGVDGARTYAEANEAGVRLLLSLGAQHGIDGDIEQLPAYTYTLLDEHVGEIEREVEVAREVGLPASLTSDAGLPFPVRAAMRWEDQAQFHPVKYVAGLARTIPGDGCHVFEGTRALDWSPDRVETEAGSVKARHVIMATHLPLGQVGMFYAENYPHSHPVIAGRAEPGRVPHGMFINVEQPRHSLRTHRSRAGDTYLVLTGPAFRGGHVDDERRSFAEIERFARDQFGVRAEYRWSNEDYTPMDGTPFVGWSSSLAHSYLVATGFDAWGISNGAAAALMLRDIIVGRDNPWLGLFDASRLDLLRGAGRFVKGNAEVTTHLVGGYLASKPSSPEALHPGEAAVMKVNGKHLAVFRDEAGEIHAVSAVCTHMGCILGWNEVDRSWDCPCHGSRFSLSGEVIHGPATKPLGSGISG